MKIVAKRWGFVLILTAVAVFFSEKAYWYPQGFAIFELILFYAIPVAATLWAMEQFGSERFSQVVLLAVLFAFLVEGVLTPVLFEGGLLDPIMPAYFVGWHGLLSIVLGWYGLRRWLVAGSWGKLLVSAALFGLFWGMWSLTYWLPEQMAEWQALAQAGEPVSGETRWSVAWFAVYAFSFTGMLIFAHGVWGWFGDTNLFLRFSRLEKVFIVILLLFFYVTLSFPGSPWGWVKLGVLLTAVLLPLFYAPKTTNFLPAGQPRLAHLFTLWLMPLLAVAVYAWGWGVQPSVQFLWDVNELTAAGQMLVGAVIFVWAIWREIWTSRQAKLS